ncbi:hypothetical protein [Rhodococcus pyridinivorans]
MTDMSGPPPLTSSPCRVGAVGYGSSSPRKDREMTTPPLLTLHTEHLDRLTPYPGISTGHWLVQDAIEAEVISWDRAVWGELIFTVGIEDYEFVVGYSVTGEVYLSRAAKVDIPHPGNPSLDPLEDDDRYPPLPDPLQQPAEFLRLVVDELNALHEASTRMVAVWPGTTGVPVLPPPRTVARIPGSGAG